MGLGLLSHRWPLRGQSSTRGLTSPPGGGGRWAHTEKVDGLGGWGSEVQDVSLSPSLTWARIGLLPRWPAEAWVPQGKSGAGSGSQHPTMVQMVSGAGP